ncbi:MAG: hypothetical protein QW179_00965 [Candidatus Hadarchaeales archaeon]
MKKNPRVLREILYRVYEKGELFMTQKSLAESCEISLDAVNRVISKLFQFRAIEKKPFGFRVVEPKKILLYWATTRNLQADIVYSTYSPDAPEEIENDMPEGTIFTAFSGYKKKYGSCPQSYDEVHVYSKNPEEIKRRHPEREAGIENIIVMRMDPHLEKLSEKSVPPIAQIYVDLWQLGGSAAERCLLALDEKLEARSTEAFKQLIGLLPKA